MAEISLELRVEVLLGVNFVGEGMQTDTILPILVQEEDLDFVDLAIAREHG